MVNLKEPEKGGNSSIFSTFLDLKNWIPKQQRQYVKNFFSFVQSKTWVGTKWLVNAAFVIGVTMIFTALPYGHVVSLDFQEEANMSKQSPYEANPKQ